MDAYSKSTTFLRVVTVTLCGVLGLILAVELVALWESCRKRKKMDSQARRFQYVFLAQTLANGVLLIFFTMEAFFAIDHNLIACGVLTKLMGIGYMIVFELFYLMMFMRAKTAGRMFMSPRYRTFMRVTEVFSYVFMPILILPALFASPSSSMQLGPDRCLLVLPTYMLIVLAVISPIVTVVVVGLFIYPLAVTANSTLNMNARTARMFRGVARFNAKVSLVALISSTITIIIFCVLTSLAQSDPSYAYLLLIAHGLALCDILLVSICSRLTLLVWMPAAMAKRLTEWMQRCLGSGSQTQQQERFGSSYHNDDTPRHDEQRGFKSFQVVGARRAPFYATTLSTPTNSPGMVTRQLGMDTPATTSSIQASSVVLRTGGAEQYRGPGNGAALHHSTTNMRSALVDPAANGMHINANPASEQSCALQLI